MKKIISLLCACLLLCSFSHESESSERITSLTPTHTSGVPISVLQDFMESFCREYYSVCFSGRKYVRNSLKVTDISYPSSQSIRVDGTHSYLGRFGVEYTSYQFYAIIRNKGPYQVEVTFYKRSAPDLWHDDYYWESCTRTVPVN